MGRRHFLAIYAFHDTLASMVTRSCMMKILLQRFVFNVTPKPTIDRHLQIDEDFKEDDLETNLLRDKHARLCILTNSLIDKLLPGAPDFTLRDVCGQLVRLIPLSGLHLSDRSTSLI